MMNLDLVETRELLREIGKRFPALVVVAICQEEGGPQSLSFYGTGGTIMTIGLMEAAKKKMLNEVRDPRPGDFPFGIF